MLGDAPRLTLIVPAFNEALRLTERAARLEDAVEGGILCPKTTELIVVDDGSTDETGWRAEELLSSTFHQLRVLRLHDNAGKGAAVRLGIAAATAPVLLFMDADMAVDPSAIPHIVKAVGPADVAIGSRSHSESVVVTDGVQRKLMGWTFNAIVGALTSMPYRDTQCGFKAFRTSLARILFHLIQVRRFAFDVEVLSLARQLQMEVAEVAVQWREIGNSTVRTLVDPLSMARDVLIVSRRREWPNTPALAISPREGERRRSPSRIVTELHRALGPNYPIVVMSEDQYLVLLPLCDPVVVQNIAANLRQLATQLSVRERSVSFTQLTKLAPFGWRDGESDGITIATPAHMAEFVTRVPVEGWESLRSNAAEYITSRPLG